MLLKKLKYSREDWSLEGREDKSKLDQFVNFSNINLLVGKNATGKSTTIEVLRALSDLFSARLDLSKIAYKTADYHVVFDDNGVEIEYELKFDDGKVIQEILKIDGIVKLNRKAKQLYYEEVGDFLSIEIEDYKLVVSRTDKQQQPFFNALYEWGRNLNHYKFGGQLGKDTFLRTISTVKEDFDTELKNIDNVSGLFLIAKKKFGKKFLNKVLSDLKRLSYRVKSIDTNKMKRIPVPAFGLVVSEEDREDFTDQVEMSQGMFRVLSLLIQLNYSILAGSASCILIDDIGEGLDYERSRELINIIVEKIKDSNIQVVMTTNDRFVMNEIPLEYWSVIHRLPKKSLIFNYENSKEIFDEFKFTGLSNFDFLKTEYYFDLDI